MTHEELRDLLGVYVLDALSPEERSMVEAHLQTCTVCHTVVLELAPVPEQLALLAPEMEPPPALRTRLLAIAEQERSQWLQAQASTMGTGAANPVGATVETTGPWTRLREWLQGTPRLALGGGVALVVVIVVAGVILATRTTSTVRTYACAALQPVVNGVTLANAGCTVHVTSGRTIDLAFNHLPALSATKAYELWALPAKGNPVPIVGFANTRTQPFQHIYQIDARTYPKAAISIEQAPGDSTAPHGPIIFVLPLTS